MDEGTFPSSTRSPAAHERPAVLDDEMDGGCGRGKRPLVHGINEMGARANLATIQIGWNDGHRRSVLEAEVGPCCALLLDRLVEDVESRIVNDGPLAEDVALLDLGPVGVHEPVHRVGGAVLPYVSGVVRFDMLSPAEVSNTHVVVCGSACPRERS